MMNVAEILDECLARLRRGETVGDCLARYPDQAAELAPMLEAAAQLRGLAAHRLSPAQRLAGQMVLRAALARRTSRRSAADWLFRPVQWMGWPALAAAVALCLFVVLSVGAVAASRPGDLTYSVRVMVERAPLLVIFDADARASAELYLAERRLADVQQALQHSRSADATALRALIRSAEAAAGAAGGLAEAERLQVAARIEEHVTQLERLAATVGEPAAARSLVETARQARAIAVQLRAEKPPALDPQRPAPTETAVPSFTPTSALTATPQPEATATLTPETTPVRSHGSPVPQPSRDATTTRRPDLRPRQTEPRPPVSSVTPLQPGAPITPTIRPTHMMPTPSATRRVGPTAVPQPATVAPQPTAEPPPGIATRRPEPTAGPPATAQPRPTEGPGDPGGRPPDITPGPPPEPRPTRRGG